MKPSPGSRWAMRLTVPCMEGQIMAINSCGEPILSVCVQEGRLRCLFTTLNDKLCFELEASPVPPEIILEWLGFSVRLYANGELLDEEWPLGELIGSDWEIDCDSSWEFVEPGSVKTDQESKFTEPMQYFNLQGSNTGVGDCMPFARDGRYCLYYLFDRRGHKSKAGLGAHQWAQISSADLKTWTIHPMAVPITEQWEGSICTGSLIQIDGRTYAFYAVRMSDKSPARMTWAISDDGVRFEKSGSYFALTEPYEPVSARDPMVFLGVDGRYHMLVTTSLTTIKRYNGCLAHLVSDDLHSWEQLEPMIVPGYADQPECSDYFEWNGWYYLVFSNFATARYRMSKKPFGPWIKPEYDILDSIENQVPKTAPYGKRRFITGFLARYPRTYAGNAVTHELVQRENGTLGIKFVHEILPVFSRTIDVPDIGIVSEEGRTESIIAEKISGFRLRGNFLLDGDAALGGFVLTIDTLEHRIDFNPFTRIISAMRPNQNFHMGDTRLQLTGINLSRNMALDMIVKDDILDLVIGEKAMTIRLNASAELMCTLSAYVQTGALSLTDIIIETEGEHVLIRN